MSTETERLAAIQDNYQDAISNEPHDLATARTAQDVTAIQANLSVAKSTYFAAVAAQLTKSGAAVEAAYEAAREANNAVRRARSDAEEIATLLGKLRRATTAATRLVDEAKKL